MDFLLKKLGLFECILLGIVLRSFIVGPTASDAAVIIALVGAIVFVKDYLNRNKVSLSEGITKEIEQLKNEINALKLDRSIKKATPTALGDNLGVRRF